MWMEKGTCTKITAINYNICVVQVTVTEYLELEGTLQGLLINILVPLFILPKISRNKYVCLCS